MFTGRENSIHLLLHDLVLLSSVYDSPSGIIVLVLHNNRIFFVKPSSGTIFMKGTQSLRAGKGLATQYFLFMKATHRNLDANLAITQEDRNRNVKFAQYFRKTRNPSDLANRLRLPRKGLIFCGRSIPSRKLKQGRKNPVGFFYTYSKYILGMSTMQLWFIGTF